MFFLLAWFVRFFYQPFFNLLVVIYWLLDQATAGHGDMGVAVILFTIAFRILWLPISLSSSRSEKERREIAQKVKEIKVEHRHDPVAQKEAIKSLLTSNRGIMVASFINIGLQVLIALMLYRIFATGLGGADLHLLYSFMPKIQEPFNLVFMGKYDLSHPNIILNLIQSLFILIAELLTNLTSPFPSTRKDVTTMVFLPIISFLIFIMLPAGKKLFIITTLGFSIVLMLVKQIVFVYHSLSGKFEAFASGAVKGEGQKEAGSS
jgi:membrane protein insertase Oxa1/YidC/SpoIIIJ